jgi:Domain of unknown function (DUF4278)
MQLIYRGVRYEATPTPVEVQEGAIGGQYRGAPWRCRTLAAAPLPQPVHQLKYRGVPYTTGTITTGTIATGTIAPATIPTELPSGSIASRILPRLARQQIDRLHRRNIQHNIERRLEIAKAKHDQVLITLLEREFEETLCRY